MHVYLYILLSVSTFSLSPPLHSWKGGIKWCRWLLQVSSDTGPCKQAITLVSINPEIIHLCLHGAVCRSVMSWGNLNGSPFIRYHSIWDGTIVMSYMTFSAVYSWLEIWTPPCTVYVFISWIWTWSHSRNDTTGELSHLRQTATRPCNSVPMLCKGIMV